MQVRVQKTLIRSIKKNLINSLDSILNIRSIGGSHQPRTTMTDAFGTLPEKPRWLLTPGTTIPASRTTMTTENAHWLTGQSDLSHFTQAVEFLNGIYGLNQEENEIDFHYKKLDEDMRSFDESHAHLDNYER